ncbi:uncharacterized protein LOC115438346 [Sphaeramia orbicularis]|uniref:uncharacterized protein LOC115438346 n=1 Tax=Sphaeramia orbicularis TaxID=375764 RepID=UPI00117DFC30|nr:uncharacterized protein LOC115438346 [Sphaeramia orbicularis]
MKALVVIVILIHISQHALAVVVQAYEGMESVLLPYQYSGMLPEVPSVVWRRSDLNQTVLHLLKYKSQYHKEEYRYSERMSMKTNALESGDFSLTLKKPQLSDSNYNYTCSLQWETNKGTKEEKLTQVQLQVKDDQVKVEVQEGAESVLMPCRTSADLPEDTRVEWTHSDPGMMAVHVVHVHPNKTDDLQTQDRFYFGRTEMNKDLSLSLKCPMDRDRGTYICTVYWKGDILRQKVLLQVVEEGFPPWAMVLLVLLVLLVVGLITIGGLLFYCRQHLKSVYKVEVDSGEESVLLPWKTTAHLMKEFRYYTVVWTNRLNRKVHVYEGGADQPDEQDWFYRNRTEMNEDLLRTGDLSLILKHPTDQDTDTYTCTVYSKDKRILMMTQVVLEVKVQQVEVNSGAESVQLPWKTKAHLREDVTIEWTDRYNRKVYIYNNGFDRPDEQDWYYRNRTDINKDPLRTGDLSLTLKHLTDWDANTYTCTVYSRDKKILMRKQEDLEVKVQLVEVDSGEESVLLPCKTVAHLTKNFRHISVKWMDFYSKKLIVHKYGSDQPDEQDPIYRNRTEMKKHWLSTRDFSLTLKHPTDRDTSSYLCIVYNKNKVLKKKRVVLEVKVQLVEVDSEVKSVLLPWKTTFQLMEDFSQITVEWTDVDVRKVHVYQYGSDRTNEQDSMYRNRTEMNEDPLRTGDLSLTLKHPTDLGSDTYTCTVYNTVKQILRRKQVRLKVTDQQVEVVSGEESVLLPWKTPFHIEDISQVTVEWTDTFDRKVHVYEDGSDRTNEQNDEYKKRTEMNEDPLRTGDLSLTLKHPTVWDTDTYTCTVYNRHKEILMRKRVNLKVEDQQVEVVSGEESVLLPWKTPFHIEDISQVTVEWTDNHDRKVHVYEDGSDRTNEQNNRYKKRTEMNEDPLRTGDLSLTLKHPTDWDTNIYTCAVYNRHKEILMRKRVHLKVKVQQVEVVSGEEPVLLPWKTTFHIEDVSQVTMEWMDGSYRKVHVYEDGSDRTDEQDSMYRNRTEMNEDPLRAGDLSLTLKHPTVWDTNIYICVVYDRDNQILMKKEVHLKVKV